MEKSPPDEDTIRAIIEAEHGVTYTPRLSINLHVIETPTGKHPQYAYAHRVNDKDHIESALDGGITGIECDIIWSKKRNSWVVQHDTPNISSAGPTLSDWLEKLLSLLKTGKYDDTFSALWLDIKSPNDESLSNAMTLVHEANLPTSISIIYDLNPIENVLGDPQGAGKGYNSIKSLLRSNEGIGVIFSPDDMDQVPTVHAKFAQDGITRSVASHGHAINIKELSGVAKLNEMNDLCSGAYCFKKIFTWTNKLQKSMEDHINPGNSYRTDGQIIGSPISEWKPKHEESAIPNFNNAVAKYSSSQRVALPSDEFWVIHPQPSSYRVVVNTGDVSRAGTNSDIYITVCGNKGNTGEIHLNADRKDFEKESTDVFHIFSVDLGTIESITVRSNGKRVASDWYLTSISFDNHYALFDKWIKEGSYTAEVINISKDYYVKVKTGNEDSAGTDADIYLTIHGDKGSTPEIRMNRYISGNAFERDNLDSFTLLGLLDVGTIRSVEVRSNGKWAKSAWYLSWISINGEQAVSNKWIDFHNCSICSKAKAISEELWNAPITRISDNTVDTMDKMTAVVTH